MTLPATIYVFGAFGGPGHYVWTTGRQWAAVPNAVWGRCDSIPFENAGRGGLDPQTEGAIIPVREWPDNERKGPYSAPRFRRPMLPGWSFVSWWDRQGDGRGGSSTGILAAGEWTDAQLIEAGRALAPWAFRVPVPGPGD